MRGLTKFAGLAVAATLCLSCGPGEPQQVRKLLPSRPHQQVDILLVVDQHVSELAEFADDLMLGLTAEAASCGPRDVHVAVISSDLGDDGQGITGCTDTGAGGELRGELCEVDGPFLIDAPLPALACLGSDGDCVERNYTGPASEKVSCMLTAAPSSCPISQPLEAMRIALEREAGGGGLFLREDVPLVIIFVLGQDDCSIRQWGDIDGPLSCALSGVVCGGEAIPAQVGEYESCTAASTPGNLAPIADYVDFLANLKEVSRTVIAVNAGGTDSISIVQGGDGGVVLAPSCTEGSLVNATPAIRMAALAEAIPRVADVPSCKADGLASLDPINGVLACPATTVRVSSANGEDLDLAYALESCSISDALANEEVQIARCEMDDSGEPVLGEIQPCWWLSRMEESALVQVERVAWPPTGTQTWITCPASLQLGPAGGGDI